MRLYTSADRDYDLLRTGGVMNATAPVYVVNEYTPTPSVVFDAAIGATYVKYAQMLVGRGYVQSSLGGMVIRASHPDYPDGIWLCEAPRSFAGGGRGRGLW